jgi:hypothetical protein
LIQAYNDYYYRTDECITPSVEEHDFIVEIIKKYIKAREWKPKDLLLKAELYRESNQMGLCLETLDALSESCVSLDETETRAFERMRKEALDGNDKVFIVFRCGRSAFVLRRERQFDEYIKADRMKQGQAPFHSKQ